MDSRKDKPKNEWSSMDHLLESLEELKNSVENANYNERVQLQMTLNDISSHLSTISQELSVLVSLMRHRR